MQFSSGTIQKLASLVPWRQNAKWREISTESTITGPNYIWIKIFLDIQISHEQGQIWRSGLMGTLSPGKKILRF